MKINVIVEVDVEKDSKIADCLRQKTLLVFNARKRKKDNIDADIEDLKAQHEAVNVDLESALKARLPFGDLKIVDVRWESTDVVSKEEEATILAPPG